MCGRRFLAIRVMDNVTREALAIEGDLYFPVRWVVRMPDRM